MPPSPVAVADGARLCPDVSVQRVEQRRLADAALADEDAGVAGQRLAHLLDALPQLGAAGQDRHAEGPVGLQPGEDLVPPLLAGQVDLVDHQHRAGSRLFDGHEVAVDESRMQRRRLRGDDHDDQVDVGGDRAPPLGDVRVGARQQAAAGQHRGDAVTLALPLQDHLVADGEVALLAAGEVARQDRRHLGPIEEHCADAGGDAGDGAACVAGRRRRRRQAGRGLVAAAAVAATRFVELRAEEFEQELVELGPARARLLRAQRRLAQPGRSPCESETFAVVETGEHRLQSSALLLIHLWMNPSGEVGEVRHDRAREGRDAESRPVRLRAQRGRRAPGASPTTEEERRTTASPAAGRPQRSGDPGCYGRALTRGDAKMPLTDRAVITFLLVVRGTRLV